MEVRVCLLWEYDEVEAEIAEDAHGLVKVVSKVNLISF